MNIFHNKWNLICAFIVCSSIWGCAHKPKHQAVELFEIVQGTPRSISALRSDVASFRSKKATLVKFNQQIYDKILSGQSYTGDIIVNLDSHTQFKVNGAHVNGPSDGLTPWSVATDSRDYGGILNLRDQNSTGIFWNEGRQFRIEPTRSSQTYLLTEIDQTKLPPHARPRLPPNASVRNYKPTLTTQCDSRLELPGPIPIPVPPGKLPIKYTIDMMVLWTPKARMQSADISSDINVMMKKLENAFTSANFIIIPRLVHSQEINFTETRSSSNDLDSLTNGRITGVHGLRNQYKADLVVMVTTHTDYCGIAWENQFISHSSHPYGYSIVQRSCGIGSETFSHEVGHNIGMKHDRETDAGQPNLGYNFGYIAHNARRRTIMAYDQPCFRRGYSCPALPTYSSPNEWFLKEAMGSGGAYNRELLCRHAGTVAGFR